METIFISIASYRDVLCSTTVRNIYENAKNPMNVFIGIVEQNNAENKNELCLSENLDKKFLNNIRITKIPYQDAKGPTFARYLCSQLYKNEDYFFQIDSHTLFVQDWDEKLLKMFKNIQDALKTEKIILSHYPSSYETYSKTPDENIKNVPTICSSFFDSRGMISFLGAQVIDMNNRDFIETPYIAAGMMFAKGHIINNVPYDPYLDYLFVGEEILYSARCWTNGYRIITPTENIVYHLYTRKDSPKIWTDKKYTDIDAFEKVKTLLKLSKQQSNLESYSFSFGKQKTLEQYYEFAGIDIENKKSNKNFCK